MAPPKHEDADELGPRDTRMDMNGWPTDFLWFVEQEQVSHEAGAQDEMRAAIRDHPFYTEMVLSHLKILKVNQSLLLSSYDRKLQNCSHMISVPSINSSAFLSKVPTSSLISLCICKTCDVIHSFLVKLNQPLPFTTVQHIAWTVYIWYLSLCPFCVTHKPQVWPASVCLIPHEMWFILNFLTNFECVIVSNCKLLQNLFP